MGFKAYAPRRRTLITIRARCRKSIALVLIAIIVQLFAHDSLLISLHAQTIKGSITGTVSDSSGAVVAGATVVIWNSNTGMSKTTRTDGSGGYKFVDLPIGTYEITVTMKGFGSAIFKDVHVAIGQDSSTNARLSVGATGPTIITAREILLSSEAEGAGYGLYSYLLFGAPPSEATRRIYLKALDAYLALPATRDLIQLVPRRQLNITYLPVKSTPQPFTSEQILNVYDYARAQVMLSKVPGGPFIQGPYIISSSVPLIKQGTLSGHYLYQDMSSVPPEVVILWVQEFMRQSSQTEFWKKRNGPQIALQIRTAIATLAVGVDPAKRAADEWQKILTALISWKSE